MDNDKALQANETMRINAQTALLQAIQGAANQGLHERARAFAEAWAWLEAPREPHGGIHNVTVAK